MKKQSIIFMGTPKFAVISLKLLVENDFNITGVITSLDKRKGRGRKISFSPVKEYAKKKKIPIYQPTNLKNPDFINKMKRKNPSLFVVVGFRMLPEVLTNIPENGTINLHSSLLPSYRGAAPINWVIINGEKETGVTTFFINNKIDEGDIIEKKKIKIEENETAGSLHDKLMEKGANLVLKSVKDIFNGNVNTSKQKISTNDKKAPKIDKKLCKIDLNSNSTKIVQLIRGLSPYPGAKIIHKHKLIKIINARISRKSKKKIIGLFEENNKIFLNNNLGESIEILELQVEGKNKMNFKDYLRGNTI